MFMAVGVSGVECYIVLEVSPKFFNTNLVIFLGNKINLFKSWNGRIGPTVFGIKTSSEHLIRVVSSYKNSNKLSSCATQNLHQLSRLKDRKHTTHWIIFGYK
jgi:hypothetical protein